MSARERSFVADEALARRGFLNLAAVKNLPPSLGRRTAHEENRQLVRTGGSAGVSSSRNGCSTPWR